MFYAIQWDYGRMTENGRRSGDYKHFATKAQRDEWVDECDEIPTSNPGFREAIPASDSEIRRYRKLFRGF